MEMFDKFMRGIKLLRVYHGMTAKEAAERSNLSHASYVRMEQGGQGYNPRLQTLMGLAKCMDMTIEEVLHFVDDLDSKLKDRLAQLQHRKDKSCVNH